MCLLAIARSITGICNWFHRVQLIRSGNDVVMTFGTAMVFTEHELQTLRRREVKLAEAQRLSQNVGWKISSGTLFWSDDTFRIIQCAPRTTPTVGFALALVHPEDRNLVQLQIERARHWLVPATWSS